MSERQAQVAHRRVVEHAAQLEEQRFLHQQQQTVQVMNYFIILWKAAPLLVTRMMAFFCLV